MDVVIVGYGMAGARLAGLLSERGGPAKVVVLGAEPHRPYNRIMLTGLLAGALEESDVELAGAAGQRVDVRTGRTATAIDRAARTVTTGAGEVLRYDHLVLATGADALVPSLAGLGTDQPAGRLPDRVAVLRTLDDYRRIRDAAAGARSALVLGGGLLGVEAARGLAARGLAVHLVHSRTHLMDRQLDPAGGAVLAGTLAGLGIGVWLAAAATAVRPGPDEVTLALADGRSLRGDLLVLACGARPRTGLARSAGLAVRQGVVVDDRLRTSDPHISAIGDCAEHGAVVGGLVAPAWEQARVVAGQLTGAAPQARYRPVPQVTRLKAAGIDLAVLGELPPPPVLERPGPATSHLPPAPDCPPPTPGCPPPALGVRSAGREQSPPAGSVLPATGGPAGPRVEELTFSDPARGTYARLVLTGDRLTGAILLGDNPTVGTLVQLFDRGTPAPADRRGLLLGRSAGPAAAPVAESPALMPDAATVCRCNTVSKGALVRCWREGARSLAEVVTATRATTGCGGCRDAVAGIVDWLATVDSPAPASPAPADRHQAPADRPEPALVDSSEVWA